MENPAVRLRNAVRRAMPSGMLRYDLSGRALLVSDAPRAGNPIKLPLETPHTVQDGLLYIDLPDDTYAALLSCHFFSPGDWRAEWFAEQSLLQGILRMPHVPGALDKPLLRAAMTACAMGETPVRAFMSTLRSAHAAALRQQSTGACHAAASLCAHFLAQSGVGLPECPAYAILSFYITCDFR